MPNQEKQDQINYGKLISHCWEDEGLKKRFIDSPVKVLKEYSLPVEDGVTYKVIDAPRLVHYVVLPHENTMNALQQVTKDLFQNLEKAKNKSFGEGAELRIIQNTAKVRYLVLPFPPHQLTAQEVSALGLNVGIAETPGVVNMTIVDVMNIAGLVSGCVSGGIITAVISNITTTVVVI
ncbi:MAG: hypothetical protein LBU17_06630 [Treponema sp.]|jgi:hypothetical protein|nr:hypothetical protein [Treponema sp.]